MKALFSLFLSAIMANRRVMRTQRAPYTENNFINIKEVKLGVVYDQKINQIELKMIISKESFLRFFEG